MKFYQGDIYHIYNRGNNKQQIFFDKDDYYLFLRKMRKKVKNECDILGWCLMPNHFHWLIRITKSPSGSKTLNNKIGNLLSSYTQAINYKYKRTGSLFQSRTKAKNLNNNGKDRSNYEQTCLLYIHQNPLRAKLVSKLEDWEFSSFSDYSGLRKGSLCNIKLAKELLQLPFSNNDFYKLSYKTIPDQHLSNFY